MIRHRNYYAMASVIDHLPMYVREDDLMLLYLPLAHNFGRLMHLTGAYVGYTIAFLPDPLQTADALQQVHPTVLPSVPRVYEKIHTAIVSAIDETSGAKRRLANWSLSVGRQVSKLEESRQPVSPVLRAKHRIADRLVFAKIRKRLGGRLRTPISGGAPLAKEIAEFFDGIGIRILEVRADRVHDSRNDEHAGAVAVRHRRPGSARLRAGIGGGRGAADPQRHGLRRLLQGSGRDRRRPRPGRMAALGRHRGDRC
jgi:acyl-CoA synthetase (AMP-forming)/AMP-acid ligase II